MTDKQWEYGTDQAYFASHSYIDVVGKSLLGLFFTKDAGGAYLYPLPTSFMKAASLKDFINIHDRAALLPYNKYNVPVEEKQLVAIMGDSKLISILTWISSTEDRKGYISKMMDFIHIYNRYDIPGLIPDLTKIIDIFISMVIAENDTFWAQRDDNMGGSLAKRMFNVDDIKITSENKEKVAELKKRIIDFKDDDAFRQATEEYPGLLLDREKKYPDVSQFLLSPFPIEDYYKDISISDYRILFATAAKLDESGTGLAIKLFGVICCSFPYYHLNLDDYVLNIVNRFEAPLITSQYVRYLMFLAYKEESTYRTYSTVKHRHMMRREVSSRLRNICRDSILPGWREAMNEEEHEATVNIGTQLFSKEETMRRMGLFTNGYTKYFTLPYPCKIYICGSIMTASSIRVPTGRDTLTDEEDKEWYDEVYKDSDVDIMCMVPKTSEGKGDLTYVKMCADLLVKTLSNEGIRVTLSPIAYRWRVETKECRFEFFPSFYDPVSLVYKFHVPAVRSYLDPIDWTIIDFPSFVYAAQTQYCLDYRHFNGTSTQVDVIRKYKRRGFVPMLSKKESEVAAIGSYDPPARWLVVSTYLQNRVWPPAVFGLGGYTGTRIPEMRKRFPRQCASYGITQAHFWHKSRNHITIPKYTITDIIGPRVKTGNLLPADAISGEEEIPSPIEEKNKQTYIIDIGGVKRLAFADRLIVGKQISKLDLPPFPYITVIIPIRTTFAAFIFLWTAVTRDIVNDGAWNRLSREEKQSILDMMTSFGMKQYNKVSLWIATKMVLMDDFWAIES